MTDCEDRTRQSPTIGVLLAHSSVDQSFKPTLESFPAGYHQYPGQRAGKVEKEICLLDTCSPSRGQGNCQRSLGRTNSPSGSETMGIPDGHRDDRQTPELVFPIFTDLSPYTDGWESFRTYERSDTDILGTQKENEKDEDDVHPTNPSRCFNCGHPDHKVTECPFRANRELIALSRQYYEFFQGTLGLGNSQRLHTVEAWRQQRLSWLEEFEPGTIKGELLKDAIADSNDEWLKNISVWGYPLGWVSHLDPRERVRDRIWNENNGDVVEELEAAEPFEIHGDEEVVELLSFEGAFHHTASSPPSPSALPLCSGPPIRWATYPTSYFSSQALVLYTPPARNEPWYSSVFDDTAAYQNQFSASNQPPPPEEEPPPLPPGLPGSGFPQNTFIHSSQFTSSCLEIPIEVKQGDSLSECDMELSDSD